MTAAIVLPPSDSTDALVVAIEQAIATNVDLILQPGLHNTRPGRAQRIVVNANGLRMRSAGPSPLPITSKVKKAMVRRPDGAVLSATPDDNYGLFFIPAAPTSDELDQVVWKTFVDPQQQPLQFGVIMRGQVEISGLLVDCNMGNQGIDALPKDAAEHSAMLGFSGFRYPVRAASSGVLPRYVYVGFERVALHDLGFINGGYADDVWITYGPGAEFHPHIAEVSIERVATANRISPRRATLGFSACAQGIGIRDADIYRFNAEREEDWKLAPRRDDTFTNATFSLSNVTAELMSFAIKGKVVSLNARQLSVPGAFGVSFAGGVIADSTLRIADTSDDSRFFRLDGLHFDRVRWQLPVSPKGEVGGIQFRSRFGDPCVATFTNNAFSADGRFAAGQLINSEYSTAAPEDSVTLSFLDCSFPRPFGSPELPRTAVARVNERGTWTFKQADLGTRRPASALPKDSHADVVLTVIR